MLKLSGITKEYVAGDTRVQALDGIDIEFRACEFVSILGPSGCGKTTLLNIVGGLDRYTSGDLEIAGRSTKKFTDRDWDTYRNHSIGFVFQSYNLIPHSSVLANVELALTLSGVSRAERRRRAAEVLKKVGLEKEMHKKPNQLSGGQMQRVAIARALVNEPEILLADEPTGALDSATSVQIMDLLKEISAEKLVIMVTHNPDLAETYSTRIVRLLDGKIVSDTDPYAGGEEPVPESAAKKKKASMPFHAAMSLSLNNLMTKKARTFLTSFAGSIGIIGIALILSLSAGVQAYIDRVEEDTLSNYPIELEQQTVDYGSMLASLAGSRRNQEEHPLDKVYTNSVITKMMNTMISEVRENNLTDFKKFLDGNEEVKTLVSDIRYGYSTVLNVYKDPVGDEAPFRVNPSSIMGEMQSSMGMDDGVRRSLDSMAQVTGSSSGTNVWRELMNNRELLEKQYDVVAGRMPENYDEAVLIISKRNEISDYTLYALGLRDASEIRENMNAMLRGEEMVEHSASFTYEEILDLKFRLVPSSALFEKKGKGWEDRSADEDFLRDVVKNAEVIRIVGILRPAEGSNMGNVSGSIGYLSSLKEHLIGVINDSEIVRAQKEHEDVDVFTGITFGKKDTAPLTMEALTAYIAALPAEEAAQMNTTIAQMNAAGMTEDRIRAMFSSAMEAQTTDATMSGNMARLGVSDLASPSRIVIYPKDFESKERLTAIIDEYNEAAEEADEIRYTDYIGLMLSSVTTVINAISYILIAFVAISLVVSSIMIGIITYISVLERTKEIGILRAVGASKGDISRVFNAETIAIGFVAGLLGILITVILDVIASIILEHITDIAGLASLPLMGGIVLIAVSVLLTFISGTIPSRIAAKKDPVVALRTE